jgi:hypothetical protein
MSAYTHACMHACIHVLTCSDLKFLSQRNVCVYMYIQTYMQVYTNKHACIYNIHVYKNIHTRIYKPTYKPIYIYIYIYIYTHLVKRTRTPTSPQSRRALIFTARAEHDHMYVCIMCVPVYIKQKSPHLYCEGRT